MSVRKTNPATTLLVASAVTIASGFLLRIIYRRRYTDKHSGIILTTPEAVQSFTSRGWRSTATRIFLRPFITTLNVTNVPSGLPPLPPKISALSFLIEVNLSGNLLESIPEPLFALRRLKKLNLSRNNILEVPAAIGQLTLLEDIDFGRNAIQFVSPTIGQLKQLRFFNLMCNKLESLPDSIGQLKSVYRFGLKSNLLKSLPDSIGDMDGLVELFLTDNHLQSLPSSMSRLTNLFKLQASFNRLTSLPPEMGYLPNLELFRVAVNNLTAVPSSFIYLDKLAWFSLAGNPACPPHPPPQPGIVHISISDLTLGKKLGDGASGDVFLGDWSSKLGKIAFKQFKSDTSPDGHSRDESAISMAVNHPALIKVLAVVDEPHGLVMDLLSGKAMAEKPNFDSLLRCRWAEGQTFDLEFVLNVGSRVAQALAYLHSLGICHGDVYAHNIVADEKGDAVLCDYGASFCYASSSFGGSMFEAQEVRAFGLFLNDLVVRLKATSNRLELDVGQQLEVLLHSCIHKAAQTRPSFSDVSRVLASIHSSFIQLSKLTNM